MPLMFLGLIVVGAAILLIYYSLNPDNRKPGEGEGARRPGARENHYEKSDDGKVVYLYDRGKKAAGAGGQSDTDDNLGASGGGEAGDSDDTD
ncbi:MAG: hypothetical protein LBH63_02660 [Clostridiales Family XIII bacterium]|jgi:hypothetical protein|nr:hypothetical protein [Clostridiales Family XIII bacterium]